MRFLIRFLLRNKHEDETTENTRLYIIKAVNDARLWKKHKHFFIQLVNYFNDRKRFTKVHYDAVRRLANG